MTEGWTDAEALRRCREEGGQEAFRLIYERHAGELLGFARRLMGGSGGLVVEEVVQEAFVRFYQALEGFDVSRPVRPYLFKIAHRVALKRLQRRKKELLEDGEALERRGPEADATAAAVESRELGEVLSEALEALAPEHRGVVVLRHIHGMTFREVGEVLGCTERTARNRLQAAAVLLERELRAKGYGAREEGR